MKVGLFFGSFNPIHTGHLVIANTVLNETGISKIWFIVSPQNPLKIKSDLLDAYVRFRLLSLAIDSDDRFEVSDVEFKMELPSYTIDTLKYLENTYPGNEFYLMLGSDSFLSLSSWKGYDQLLQRDLIVYQRPGFLLPQHPYPDNITLLSSALLEISSTEIRTLLKSNKSARYLLPDVVLTEIERNKYYK